MKQLGLAVTLYLRDDDDHLSLVNWRELLVPYLSLAGRSLNEFYQPDSNASRTVLLYEIEVGKVAFRHEGERIS